MQPTSTDAAASLADRLNDPKTVESLNRLLDHADDLDRLVSTAKTLEETVTNLIAIGTDMFDNLAARQAATGVGLEQRAENLIAILMTMTEPQNVKAIQSLASRLPQLAAAAEMADEVPNLVAIVTDVFDEWAVKLKADGIELETALRQGLHTALWMGQRVSEVELDRMGMLLRSDVMDESAVETVGMAGSALARCHKGTCEHPVPQRVGMFGILTALRDPNTQRAVAFGLQFAKCFGSVLDAKSSQRNPTKTS